GERNTKGTTKSVFWCFLCLPFVPFVFRPHSPGLYILLKPFRVLRTVNVPSCCAETLIQYAVPLCAGGGGVFGPGCGAGIGAIGIADGASSIPLAMKRPGTVYSCPLNCEKWICQRSSRPGEVC